MDSLSKEKLTYFKNKKKLTNKKISKLTGLPISSIDKLFSGLNKNPTLDTLKRIAAILNCSIDDFINYDSAPLNGYYADRQTEKIAKIIQGNNKLKTLFDKIKELSDDDLLFITSVTNRLCQ